MVIQVVSDVVQKLLDATTNKGLTSLVSMRSLRPNGVFVPRH